MPGARVERSRKSRNGTDVLHGVGPAVEPGTLAVVLGRSGCGKPNVLRLIAGLDRPDGGRVFIGGRDVTDRSPSGRALSMVFQN